MWREDDFEDRGNQNKVVLKHKAEESINDRDLEPEGNAERSDEEPGS